MSSATTNNSPALEMARCPNCDYVIEQMGARTNCPKCGKQITVKCIVCQTNNPPIFQFCFKCGSDYRFYAVEHYSKRLAKIEFDLKQHELLVALKMRVDLFEQIFRIAVSVFTIIVGIFCLLFMAMSASQALLLSIPLICCLIVKLFGRRFALFLAGMPRQCFEEWRQICLIANRQKTERNELYKQHKYYQHELNQFRQRLSSNKHPQPTTGTE